MTVPSGETFSKTHQHLAAPACHGRMISVCQTLCFAGLCFGLIFTLSDHWLFGLPWLFGCAYLTYALVSSDLNLNTVPWSLGWVGYGWHSQGSKGLRKAQYGTFVCFGALKFLASTDALGWIWSKFVFVAQKCPFLSLTHTITWSWILKREGQRSLLKWILFMQTSWTSDTDTWAQMLVRRAC